MPSRPTRVRETNSSALCACAELDIATATAEFFRVFQVDPQIGRLAFDIAGNAVTVGRKYRRELHPPGILSQLLIDCLEPPLRRQVGNSLDFKCYDTVGSRRQIVVDLPIDKSKQRDDENGKHARHHERPVERVRADELRLTHRNFAARMSLLDANISARRRSHLKATIPREE